MADYFSSNHFKLLNRWKSIPYDNTNPEQVSAYAELSKAYDLTKQWTEAVQKQLFPPGWTKIVRKPTDRSGKFTGYTWGRIYPSEAASENLAYTVGLEGSAGFLVKIDTVLADPKLRARFEAIRNSLASKTPIDLLLPASDGLSMTMNDLVAWSIKAIRDFKIRYEDLADQLQLKKQLSDEEILAHFDEKQSFKQFRVAWTSYDTLLFVRLARAAHNAGLDWWHTGEGLQVRFGRKNPGSERATAVLGVMFPTRVRTISWRRPLGSLKKMDREPLTDTLVAQIEKVFRSERDDLDGWLTAETERPGLWPDQLQPDPADPQDIDRVEAPQTHAANRKPFNRIYYGPPGTGKTYELTQLLKREYEQATTDVTPEEWRREFIAEKFATLKWWEVCAVALEDLGGSAKVAQLHDHPFTQAVAAAKGRTQNVHQTLWGTLQHHTIEESTTVKLKLRLGPAIFDKTGDSVWHFAGDWREECADLLGLVEELKKGPTPTGSVQRYSFVTFHQSYGYEEFVEGLRPVLQGEGEETDVRYEIRPGAFKKLCDRARLSKDQHFAMVIDEINRGNISKIFGELITLIEVDKRDGAKHPVSVTLPYSGEVFSIPSNVDIIGTMNTADRSLALLDTALRRRFEFIPVLPDSRDETNAPLFGLRVTLGDLTIDVPRMLTAINQRIEALYDRDHTIGHAYFTGLSDEKDGVARMKELADVFRNRIVPLLEEYFFEDWQKIRLVLADNQKSVAEQFIVASGEHEQDLGSLFGTDHGLESYSTKRRFRVQTDAFSNPLSYTRIYETLAIELEVPG